MSGRRWVVPAIVEGAGAAGSGSEEEEEGWEVGWVPVRSVFLLLVFWLFDLVEE